MLLENIALAERFILQFSLSAQNEADSFSLAWRWESAGSAYVCYM